MCFEIEKNKKIDKINSFLAKYLDAQYPEVLYEAMAYSVNAGGKRMRPLILLAACEGTGGCDADAMPFACALEMIHTYSLIHDDLPAMDNDDLRRGKPSNHKVFGEATAMLAGDGLLNLAYETMAYACLRDIRSSYERAVIVSGPDARTSGCAEAMHTIATAAGCLGMVGGQMADMLSENKNVNADTLLYIHNHKTGALITAAFTAGGMLGGASERQLEVLKSAGASFGLAFQIMDDILDVSGGGKLGKPLGSDKKNNKNTYVSIYGLEKAEEDYRRLSSEAADLIRGLRLQGGFLSELMNSLLTRDY